MRLPSRFLERARRILLPASLVAGAAGLAFFLNRRVPMQTWLFWTYAGFVFATLVWAAACLSVGHLALGRLPGLRLPLRERLAFDFAVGVLLFAVGLFGLGLFGLLRPPFFFVYPVGLVAIGARGLFLYLRRAWRHLRPARRRAGLPPSLPHLGAIVLGTLGLTIVYLSIMVPENSAFDARTYHLPVAEHYAAWGRVGRFPEGWYDGVLPHLASWLYTWPFTLRTVNLFGHVVLAAHLEFGLFVATVFFTPLLVEAICPGRRVRGTWAVFFLFPGLYLYDSSLGLAADHVLAFWAIPLALAVRRLLRDPASPGRGALVGLMMAAAALTKYQAIYLLIPSALVIGGAVLRQLWRQRGAGVEARRGARGSILRGPGAMAAAAIVATAPHWLANLVWHGNPVYPMLLRVFPSRPLVPGWTGPWMDEGWQPTGSLLEKLGETLAATFRFPFVPHDWPPFHRDLPVFGFLFTLTLPVLFLARGAGRARLLAVATLVAVFIWYGTFHQDRYLQAILPWMVACTAAGLIFAWRSGAVARGGAVALVALQLVWGGDVPWLPTHAMIHDVPALRALRMMSSTFRGDIRARTRFDTGFEEVDRTLPRQAVVLFHEEYLRLGLNRRAIADSARWQAAIDYRLLGRPDRVHDLLVGLGVTHLVWSRSHSINREIPVSGELVFFAYALRHAEDRRDAGPFVLARVPPQRPPAREPGPVAYVGCAGAHAVSLQEIDRLVATEGRAAGPGGDPGALLQSADFAVVDPRCQGGLHGVLAASFVEAPRWGELTLWVKRR